MKKLFGTLFILICVASVSPAAESVQKTFCIPAVGYENIDALKAELLLQAKRMAVGQLYGEMISGFSKSEDFVLTKDRIMAYTSGMVRIQGSPHYANGSNFGEVCVTINAYITEQDRTKLAPVNISKKHCGSDPNMSTGKLKKHIMDQAIISKLLNYEPKLRDVEEKDVLRLAHKVKFTKTGFIQDTETYCASFEGIVYPAEIASLAQEAARPVNVTPLIDSLSNSAFTASSTWSNHYTGYGPSNAHFSDIRTESNWSANVNNTNQWLQIDLGKTAIIAAVGTMGRITGYNQYVKSYKLAYSLDGSVWKFVKANGADKIFSGNTDTTTAVSNDLKKPVKARYLRFHPVTWNSHITMRVEAYGVYR
ncbi:MAG: discoidin domain-containing protein [Desulfobacterales bacterium]|jgi:hypothetical protein|nr:discoidin domain-containing protein [Desulfobacteraceae bacterium]MBT4363598.1 discoidin domain-containing protein [Desulfobacteraceae bacterium]MBT7084962.1 discoidin domain-containing protein [Desulfobacterales bacterium]MBT7696582.1 discoidin domain-containing protein [Desulfobacterales bacterium]